MDGNGRWAKHQGKDRLFGHSNGVESIRETLKTAQELGVKYITLYAFSTENWSRPKEEIDGLMELLVESIQVELDTLNENGVRLETIGDISSLPAACIKGLSHAKEKTINNKNITLILALNYSSREELVRSFKLLGNELLAGNLSINDINVACISAHLYTNRFPDPELVIRTSGEHRLSNFLLWQLAYAELHFTPIFWPEFRKEHLIEAIYDFQKRERRFGMTTEQIKETR